MLLYLLAFLALAQPRIQEAGNATAIELQESSDVTSSDLAPIELTYRQVGEHSLALHVFRPADWKEGDARAGIVFFFGGGWVSGDPSQFYPHCRALAERGMVAISAEYRVEKRHGTTPFDCVRDGKAAIRWVRAHADELGIDRDRIAAGGGSAGGQVAAATAALDAFDEEDADADVSCRPDALVLFNPVFDNGPDGYGHERVKERWKAFSPLHNIDASAPPTIVFLGTKDGLVPVATAEAYQRAVEVVGGRCELHLYEGAEHGFFNHERGDNEHYDSTLMRTEHFLESIGFLNPPSSHSPDGAEDRASLKLWPNGLPPGAQPIAPELAESLRAESDAEYIRFVDEPTITLYPAPSSLATGRSVLICPGGGYNLLAWRKEGLELAEWFNSIGVTAAVLKYRVPRRDPSQPHVEPLQDAQRALRLLRHHAQEWGIEPNEIGILGFSAGGHLAVLAGTHWDRPAYEARDEIDSISCRPDFLCPIYAAYLGDDYRDDTAQLGELVRVTKETPPTFLAVTADDRRRGAQAALLFVELREHDVSAELHVYAKGGHDYGIRPSGLPVSTWHHRLADWLEGLE